MMYMEGAVRDEDGKSGNEQEDPTPNRRERRIRECQ